MQTRTVGQGLNAGSINAKPALNNWPQYVIYFDIEKADI